MVDNILSKVGKTILSFLASAVIVATSYLSPQKAVPSKKVDTEPYAVKESVGNVLGVADDVYNGRLKFNLPVIFENSVNVSSDVAVGGKLVVKGSLIAPNVVEKVKGGDGITVEGEKEVIVKNSGVISLQGKTGKLSLEEGTGIKIEDLKISVDLSAGSGISISGNEITNTDKGSSQNIFKTIAVSGQDSIVASSNNDTLTFVAGEGVSITTDATLKKLTISVGSLAVAGGWTDSGDVIYLTTSTDKVGIGTSSPTEKLEVVGNVKVSGNLNVNGIDNNGAGISNAGSITGATGLTSSGTITFSDLSTGILHADFNGVISSSPVDLSSSDVTNVLPASKGGTGISSYSKGDILYASASGVLSTLPVGGEGQVLVVSGGVPTWGAVTGGTGGTCTNCLINNPGSTQEIVPTSSTATGLVIRQAQGGTVDIFKITDYSGTTNYLRVDSSGNVILGNGGLSTGTFTVNPSGSDPIAISPTSAGTSAYTGTITSQDLTQARTWTFPDLSGEVCLSSGNCSGTSAAIGGSGTGNYIAKWQGSYSITNSIIYDTGTYVGIGTTNPTNTLHVVGTGYFSSNVNIGGTLDVTGAVSLSNTLTVTGAVDFNSTLGVAGNSTFSANVTVTGNTSVGGNLLVTGTGSSYFSSGMVGIGTTNPQYRLDVVDDYGSDKRVRFVGVDAVLILKRYENLSKNLRIAFTASNDATWWTIGMNGSGNFVIDDKINNTVRLFVGTNGRVGIGTTNPGEKLEISGNILLSSVGNSLKLGSLGYLEATTSVGNVVTLQSAGTLDFKIADRVSAEILYTDINFFSNLHMNDHTIYGSEASGGNLILESTVNSSKGGIILNPNGGNVGIGTSSPVGILHVTGAATGKSLAIFNETGDQNILVASASGQTKFVITNAGKVGIGTENPSVELDVNGSLNLASSGSLQFGGTPVLKYYSSNYAIGLGYLAGANKYSSIGIGYYAGYGSYYNYNVAIGHYAGYLSKQAYQVAIGYNAGYSGSGGSAVYDQIAIGAFAGYYNAGHSQIALGRYAGYYNSGNYSIMQGYYAGYFNSGSYSVGLGYEALRSNSGNNVIALGYQAGKDNTASNVFIVKQGNVNTTPLLLGDFTNGYLGISTNSATARLQVGGPGDGSVALANNWNTFSDIRFKTNIEEIPNALHKVLSLEGVYFDWKGSGEHSLGFIAQQVQDVIPEIVFQDKNGYLSVDYSRLTPVLVEAIKEQQTQINENKLRIDEFGNVIYGSSQTQQSVANSSSGSQNSVSQDKALGLLEVFDLKDKVLAVVKEVVFKAKAVFNSSVEFIGSVVFKNRVIFEDKDVGGYAVIRAGDDRVEVSFEKPFSTLPIVVVTPLSQVEKYFVESVSESGFVIKVASPVLSDVKFSWIALSVKGAKVYESKGTAVPNSTSSSAQPTSTPTPTPTTAPTSTPTPTPSPTSALTPTPTATPSMTPTPTLTPTATPSAGI